MMDINEIRRQTVEDYKQKMAAEQNVVAEQEFLKIQLDNVKKTVLQRVLTKEARARLANVRVANQALAEQVEVALIEAAQLGQISGQIDEEKLKEILNRANAEKKNFRIVK